MTREEYLAKRNDMFAKADELKSDVDKSAEFNAILSDIEKLDADFETIKKAQADIDALKGAVAIPNLENIGVGAKGADKVDELSSGIVDMQDIEDTKEFRNAYLKQLQGKALTQKENTVVSAASTIPTMTLNKIIEKLEQTSVLYSKITTSFLPGGLVLPRENAKNDASWVAMGTASTDSADSFDSITLSAYKLIKTIEIGADVKAMSIDAFEGFIVNALVKKMNKAIENIILNGTGSGQPTGLLKSGEISATGTYTKVGMTYTDLMKIIKDLPTSYNANAAFVMPRAVFFSDIMAMVGSDGHPVVHTDIETPSKFNILGYPVLLDDYMTTDKIIFGDLSYYHLNWSKAIEITNDTSVGFRTGTTVYRGLALLDGAPTMNEAFVLYTRAAS